MRRLFSIIFVVLVLMNAMGYYGVFMGLAIRNDALMVQRLDLNEFEESHYLTIKIPLALPYAPDAVDYHRVDGQFEHNGEVYRLLKQKLSGDTLSVICVRDVQAKKINLALTAYLKSFSENNSTNHSSAQISITFTRDYVGSGFELMTASSSWQKEIVKNSIEKVFISTYTVDVVHPPERA